MAFHIEICRVELCTKSCWCLYLANQMTKGMVKITIVIAV